MSCPPVQFLEKDVLDTVKACIRDNGNYYFTVTFSLSHLPRLKLILLSSNKRRYFRSEFGVP